MSITYAQMQTLVKPFFLSRWWDELCNPERLMFYTNASIQDVYNLDGMTDRYVTETITAYVDEGNYRKFVSTYPIDKMEEAFDQNWSELTPTLYIPCDCELKFQGKNILTSQDVTSIAVTYIKLYEWQQWPANKDVVIPLADKYIPALTKLIYDWAAPINLMAGESATFDFFSHAMNRLTTISNNDGITNTFTVKPARN